MNQILQSKPDEAKPGSLWRCQDEAERIRFYQAATDTLLAPWTEFLWHTVQAKLAEVKHGNLPLWRQTIAALPELVLSSSDLDTGVLRAGLPEDCDDAARQQLYRLLQQLHPWRKGPFEICGMTIDAEWRSDWKWKRVQPHIKPLAGRLTLDIGCGNGYYCWRTVGAGAKFALGIEPYLLSYTQYLALRQLFGQHLMTVLPLAAEELPDTMRAFDTVFSMGVLYHLPNPLAHLEKIRGLLRPGGELVLETLVIDGGAGDILVPEGRYAKMRNVHQIPSCRCLEEQLTKLGFSHARTVDFTRTTVKEQRSTDWMRWHSLQDYLDPNNPQLTCEGYPAPIRAVIVAEAP